jgi:dihydrofolate reductase
MIKYEKAQGGGDMYVFGSADLSETFINDNLFDEYRIGIAPVILGSGRPLFGQGISSKNLSLVSTQQLSTGGVVLTYAKGLARNKNALSNNNFFFFLLPENKTNTSFSSIKFTQPEC